MQLCARVKAQIYPAKCTASQKASFDGRLLWRTWRARADAFHRWPVVTREVLGGFRTGMTVIDGKHDSLRRLRRC